MAFHWATFRTRALSAIIFAVVMLAGLLIDRWSFLLLFMFIHTGCWWEYTRLQQKIHQSTFHINFRIGFIVLGLGILLLFCGNRYHINDYSLAGNLALPVSAAGFALLILGIFRTSRVSTPVFLSCFAGLLYITLSCGLIIYLRQIITIENDDNFKTVERASRIYDLRALWFCLLLILTMWINDTMAYIVGSLIGKTPLSPISPKKTWEGTIGGIILAALVIGLIGYYLLDDVYHKGLPFVFWCGMGLTGAITGTLGDLLESKLKRTAGVKDSGAVMPGHGGFLDRFDSLLLATPFVVGYIVLLVPH